LTRIRDPGVEKFGSEIRYKHPGYAALTFSFSFSAAAGLSQKIFNRKERIPVVM
jgi:hypothetical protein